MGVCTLHRDGSTNPPLISARSLSLSSFISLLLCFRLSRPLSAIPFHNHRERRIYTHTSGGSVLFPLSQLCLSLFFVRSLARTRGLCAGSLSMRGVELFSGKTLGEHAGVIVGKWIGRVLGV